MHELRDACARAVAAALDERHALEQHLHDGVQQSLLALRVRLGAAAELAAGDPALSGELGELGDALDAAIAELREVAHDVYPGVLADLGLAAALRSLAARHGLRVEIGDDGVGRYPAAVEYAVYDACREALRPAGAGGRVSIRLRDDGEELAFEVHAPAAASGHAGLGAVRDRLAALDGRLRIDPAPDGIVVSGSVRHSWGAPAGA